MTKEKLKYDFSFEVIYLPYPLLYKIRLLFKFAYRFFDLSVSGIVLDRMRLIWEKYGKMGVINDTGLVVIGHAQSCFFVRKIITRNRQFVQRRIMQ